MAVKSTVGKPGAEVAARFAYAAWMSWPQLVVFGVLVGLPAYLGIPVWFLFLGRHLGASAG